MGTRLIVDNQHRLHEINDNNGVEHNKAVIIIAKILSYIFHPVFIPLAVIAFMLYLHPFLFAGFSNWDKTKVFLQATLMFTFFPLVTVLLLRGLNFISSIQLKTQKDRIIPLVACGIWYFWVWNVWHNLPGYPHEAVVFAMASFIASSIALLLNVYMKVSLHAISAGVMLSFMVWLGLTQEISSGLFISVALFLTGLVCTVRLIASDHSQKEIYIGLLTGLVGLLGSLVIA
jgi:hypothetical protein